MKVGVVARSASAIVGTAAKAMIRNYDGDCRKPDCVLSREPPRLPSANTLERAVGDVARSSARWFGMGAATNVDTCCLAHDLRASKMLRLDEHIRWAEENGALEAIAAFLRGLPEEDWNHIGEWPSSG